MTRPILAAFSLLIVCICGCAQTLPPQEGLNQAVKKSFEATGLNYRSESRVSTLNLSKSKVLPDLKDKRIKNLDSGLNIMRSISEKADVAYDSKTKRIETVYEMHYSKDNAEVSIKIPLLLDYKTKTIYIGKSVFNTVLEAAYPQLPPIGEGLIKIDLNELLKDDKTGKEALDKIFGEDRFSPKNIDLIVKAIKEGVLKSLAKVDKQRFSDLPTTAKDRSAGIERRIHLVLEKKDVVDYICNILDAVSLSLFQDSVISEKEYSVILSLDYKQKLATVSEEFAMAMVLDFGIHSSGYVGLIESQLTIGDGEGFKIELSNLNSFSNYNSPQFSIIPEKHNLLDFKQVMDVIKSEMAKGKEASKPNAVAPETPENEASPKP
jgi:hypothetical protein